MVNEMIYSPKYTHGMPFFDSLDTSVSFYRNRSFISLLEVDNPLVVPCGTNIRLSITSDDVIHS